MNQVSLDELNFSEKFECEGKLNKAIPAKPCEELWEEFVDFDQKTITDNRRIPTIQIDYYGKNNFDIPVPQFSEKMPIYDNQSNIIGIVGCDKMIDVSTLLFYMDHLNRKTIQFDAPNDLFTG